jgi:hypothetical protein
VKESALSLAQLVLSQDAESSLRQMSLGVLHARRLSLDGVVVFSRFGIALCDYRTQKVREGTLVSVFPAIQRRCAAAGGRFFLASHLYWATEWCMILLS